MQRQWKRKKIQQQHEQKQGIQKKISRKKRKPQERKQRKPRLKETTQTPSARATKSYRKQHMMPGPLPTEKDLSGHSSLEISVNEHGAIAAGTILETSSAPQPRRKRPRLCKPQNSTFQPTANKILSQCRKVYNTYESLSNPCISLRQCRKI
ncbi:MAG: hypothetical protein Q9181_001603 [Wetmoreana brouardii]